MAITLSNCWAPLAQGLPRNLDVISNPGSGHRPLRLKPSMWALHAKHPERPGVLLAVWVGAGRPAPS